MSLFETLSDGGKQYNATLNSGSDTFEKPEAAQEDCPNCEGYGHINFPEYQEQCFFCCGTGKVDKPEPSPTVSLYNLLDHSYDNLFVLLQAVKRMEIEVRPEKLVQSFTYTTLCSWILLLETAIKERQARDSEAWAEKTAKL